VGGSEPGEVAGDGDEVDAAVALVELHDFEVLVVALPRPTPGSPADAPASPVTSSSRSPARTPAPSWSAPPPHDPEPSSRS
jgi:hypothetical protein